MIEILKATKYYGFKSSGWVVLVNGHPYHFTGTTAKKDADAAVEAFKGI
jgi:hypothetical protein